MKKILASILLIALAAVSLTACGNPGSSANIITADEDGYAEGGMGDTMRTYFFDYTVHSAYLCSEYQGYVPQDGNELLVADVTVKNSHREAITMYDSDFQVQWNDDADDAWDIPITYYLEEGQVLGDEVLPALYDLKVGESRQGLLIFEVPEGNEDFSISYQELFDADNESDAYGAVFFVYFTAQHQ